MMRRCVQIAAIGLLAASGCLSGSYNEDFRASLERYREAGEFQRLHQEPKSLAGDRLLLRVPKLFASEDAAGEKKVSKPPILKEFPVFVISVSESPKDVGAASPAALSVGVLTDNESGLEEIKKTVLNQVHKEAAFAQAGWTAVDVQPTAGGPSAWSVLKLVGPQPFDRVNNGVAESNNTEGETQIWVASDPGTKVSAVLLWRVAQERAATVQLEELAGLVARTVEFKAAAEPAAAAVAPAAAAPAGAGGPAPAAAK